MCGLTGFLDARPAYDPEQVVGAMTAMSGSTPRPALPSATAGYRFSTYRRPAISRWSPPVAAVWPWTACCVPNPSADAGGSSCPDAGTGNTNSGRC